jgi:hypothetical protein
VAGDETQEKAVQKVKLDFAKNTRRNMFANALGSGIKLLFPFLNRTLFLWLLGPKYLGLNGLSVRWHCRDASQVSSLHKRRSHGQD